MSLSGGGEIGNWSADWLWGIVMIVLTITVHSACLTLIGDHLFRLRMRLLPSLRNQRLMLITLVTAVVSLAIALLFALAAVLWAIAYMLLGALPDFSRAIYYSLTMITTTGYDGVHLAPHWRLMGLLEAVAGVLLAGISTAFLFAVLQKIWTPP